MFHSKNIKRIESNVGELFWESQVRKKLKIWKKYEEQVREKEREEFDPKLSNRIFLTNYSKNILSKLIYSN